MSSHNRVSVAGLLIALGIIFGDIGTSPLYVLNAITSGKTITEELIIGALSLIIWTLTLQTTVKYVILTLRADNKGEGGIFSLFALVRRRRKWLVIPAMIGGAALLADGMITPPISVTSAIEGLKQIPAFHDISQWTVIIIVICILSVLFFLQQFGTAFIGRSFGPVMAVWFVMLATLGFAQLVQDLSILKAFNPYYGIKLLIAYPKGFYILGGVFLCTTGAEALYSDLGHCGKWNIRYSWIFVKTCLIINYLGQGAWLLLNHNGEVISSSLIEDGFNPFYGIMPHWFIYFGITIATAATIIASQALISGSFTLVSEAMRLNLFPKFKINYPTEAKGQLYIPAVNLLLFTGCIGIVLFFKKASNMEAAYGLAITVTMIATSVLFANYLVTRRTKPAFIYLYLAVYFAIEFSFFYANLEKFPHGGYVTLLVGGLLFFVMYDWFKARKIKNRYIEFVRLDHYIQKLQELSNDVTVPKYATHLIYLTSADNPKEIEHKIIYSIMNRKPKRADIYWFIHVDTVDDPYTTEYSVTHIIPNDIIRIEFRLGFRVQTRIDSMFRKVVEDLVKNREVNVTSRYVSLERNHIAGDVQFIVMEKYLSQDNELPFWERIMMKFHFWLKEISLSEERGFGLDPSNVTVEKFPLIVAPVSNLRLKRIEEYEG
ncbi:KUP/HAK/KT family potassium transporter [Lacibacter sp.]|uniref:KUP/HAK/KT family potassium transporter n=1 Tax=Lacibacter sp. TaxID=1915409 RepID=UPI002B4B3CC2|nr:KUP/HAK/KT family potassium transporter [Lacibacter sp.]HLP39814.1 KUP/HAK/KT family potassium transporter [Lacibacter sp.]